MLDGSKKTGLLTVTLETTYSVDFISLTHDGRDEKVLIDSVKSYTISNDVYVPKKLNLDFDGPLKLLFVKKLTPDSSRIQLYELYQNGMQRDTRENLLLYFISLPVFDRYETWGMGNKNLVPNFHEKMSKLVADCKTLSAKIKSQQKGYYFSQLTLSNIKKREVLQKIIEEYNLCR
jgi:hypothetical protein